MVAETNKNKTLISRCFLNFVLDEYPPPNFPEEVLVVLNQNVCHKYLIIKILLVLY